VIASEPKNNESPQVAKAVSVTLVKLAFPDMSKLPSTVLSAGNETEVKAARPVAEKEVSVPKALISVGNEIVATFGEVYLLQQLIVVLNAEQFAPSQLRIL